MIDRRICAALALVALSACSGGGGSTPSAGSSTLSVAMVDAPFAMSGDTVTGVYLGIDKVEAVGTSGTTVIKDFGSTPDVVNILSYTTAASPLQFPAAAIAAGTYPQIRFVLDSATTTIAYKDSTGAAHTAPLTVPSGTTGGFGNASSTDAGDGPGTSGFKVNVGLNAVAGATYGYILDFNAAQSIVTTGGGNFILKPVIVATAVQTSGSISGTVMNQAKTLAVGGAEVDAVQNSVTINSGLTATDGTFTINALPAGSYSLVVKNSGTTLAGQTLTVTNYDTSVGATLAVPGTVTVTVGNTVSAGTIAD